MTYYIRNNVLLLFFKNGEVVEIMSFHSIKLPIATARVIDVLFSTKATVGKIE